MRIKPSIAQLGYMYIWIGKLNGWNALCYILHLDCQPYFVNVVKNGRWEVSVGHFKQNSNCFISLPWLSKQMDAINPLMTRNSLEQVVIHWGIRFPLKLMD
jgi:hypothetical protein